MAQVTVTVPPRPIALVDLSNIDATAQQGADFLDGIEANAADIVLTPAGTGATQRTAKAKLSDFVNAKDYGVDESGGSADQTTAILAADAAARAQGKALRFFGTPRIKTTITLNHPTTWIFETRHFQPGQLEGSCYLLKDVSCTGPGLLIAAGGHATHISGGGMICGTGTGADGAGDGVQILANNVTLEHFNVQGAKRNGFRIGGDAGPADNCDAFKLIRCSAYYNGQDGLNIDDQSGTTDTNAGEVAGCTFSNNLRHGIYANKSFLGTVLLGNIMEANVGYGLYFDTNAQHFVVIGGDIEANTAGNVFETTAYANAFVGVPVQGKIKNSFAQGGTFTPVLSGTATAGVGTYTIQKGAFAIAGAAVQWWAHLQWTAHTGTGQMQTNLPSVVYPGAVIPDFFPCIVDSDGFALSAGAQIAGEVQAVNSTVKIYTKNAGALAAFPTGTTALPASGHLYISGSYPLNVPNFYYP